MSANMKSLVWYSPTTFKANGYTIPTTWDEPDAARPTRSRPPARPSRGAAASGPVRRPAGRPPTGSRRSSCATTGRTSTTSGSATTSSSTRPRSRRRWTTSTSWMRNPKYVNGGFGDVKTIATTTFQDAGKPILTNKCAMLQQASFYEAQWPTGTTVGPDGDVMRVLPAADQHAVREPGRGWRRVRHRVLRPSRGAGRADLPVDPAVGQQPGQGRDRLGLREQRRRPVACTPTRSTSCR